MAGQIEQLLNRELSEDTTDNRVASEVRQIFADHDLPTPALVGRQAAEDYIVVAAHEQPITFLQRVLVVLKRAVDVGEIPATSYLYLRARLRQQRIEQEASHAPTKPDLRDQIEHLFKIDQSVRQREGFDPKKMEEIDKRDGLEEQSIFAQYGIPTYTMVGPKVANDFVVLILHQPLAFMRQILPGLKQEVEGGQADPSNYASMFDRVQTDEHKPQRYGMNFVCTPDGKLVPALLEDAAHLDLRRAEIGLLPMRLYARLVIENSPKDFCEKIAQSRKGRQ